MTVGGRGDRAGRLTENRAGAWGTSSADFMHVVRLLFANSKSYADSIDGNCSPYALPAIAMLLTSVRCLVIEYASYPPADLAMLEALTEGNDFMAILSKYKIEDPLRSEALLMQELRHEILHPAHRPSGTRDNLPDYLRTLKQRGLLQSTGRADSDYIFLSQLQSHRLFEWAWQVTHGIVARVLHSDPEKHQTLENFLQNYEPAGRP
jgi:hypothetical protein